MSTSRDEAPDRDFRLEEVVAEYLEAVEAGGSTDRAAILRAHPDLSKELEAFFADHDEVRGLTAPLREVARAAQIEAIDDLLLSPRGNAAADAGPDAVGLPQDGESGDASRGIGGRAFAGYELIRQIGYGGMGVVYEARQRSLNRTVALKMILAGEFASTADVKRFQAEAEAVAHLDHPNIVPVYEVGEHCGRHYFSMRLIEGGSLAEHLEDFRCEPRSAARLAATVARAVHHAHTRGILHRDLKPSNILLDGEKQPHVTDFGLAKRVEVDSELTQSGAILGSPSHMAPEQASGRRGEITTATDVYGLGAVLYSLLAGRPPFRGDSVQETIDQVRDRAPEPLSGINRLVDRDLQTICLKCLEKEPPRRYDSAEALAEDLERWLAGASIQARPVGWGEHLWNWCRRNPVVAGLTSSVTLLLILVLVGLPIGMVLIARQRDEARLRTHQARQAVDKMYTQVAERWLADQPQLEPVQREFLEGALQFYEEFARAQGTDPAMRQEAGMAFSRMGAIQYKLGQFDKAETNLRRAIDLQERLTAEFPTQSTCWRDLATSFYSLGRLCEDTGSRREAERVHRRALAIRERLVAHAPAAAELRHDLGMSSNSLGRYLLDEKRLQEAEPPLLRALTFREGLAAEFPWVSDYRRYVAGSCLNLGSVRKGTGRLGEAEQLYRRAVALQEELAAHDPGRPKYKFDLANGYHNLARLLRETGQIAEAEQLLHRAVDLNKGLAASSPDVPEYRQRIGDTHVTLGQLLERTGRPREAGQVQSQALDLFLSLQSDYPALPYGPHVARRSNELAWLLATYPDPKFRDPARSVELAKKATKQLPETGRIEASEVGLFWRTLGVASYRAGDWKAAIRAFERSMKLRSGGDASDWFFLAMAHWQMGRRDEASQWYNRAVQSMEINQPRDDELSRFRAEAAALLGPPEQASP